MREKNDFYSLLSDTTFKYLFKTDVGKRFYCKVIYELLEIDLSNYHILDGDLSVMERILE